MTLLFCEEGAPAGLHGQGAAGVGIFPCATLLPLCLPTQALKPTSLGTKDLWFPKNRL